MWLHERSLGKDLGLCANSVAGPIFDVRSIMARLQTRGNPAAVYRLAPPTSTISILRNSRVISNRRSHYMVDAKKGKP